MYKVQIKNAAEDFCFNGRCYPISELEGKYIVDEEGGGGGDSSLLECDWYYAKDNDTTSGVYEKLEPQSTPGGSQAIIKVDSFRIAVALIALPKGYDPQGKKADAVMQDAPFSGMYTSTVNNWLYVDNNKLGIHLELTQY